MEKTTQSNLRLRIRASAIHLGISFALATVAAMLVFGIWYPYPYRDSSGGKELFLIITSVDVMLGPLITLAVFNVKKPFRELRRDLLIVVVFQLSALVYGLWVVCMARPVQLVFEFDRFRVVHAIEIPSDLIEQAPKGIKPLPLTGPTLLAVRPFRNADEAREATLAALGGVALSARPDLWQPYTDAKDRVLAEAKTITELKARNPKYQPQIDEAIRELKLPETDLRYLPMVERKSFWTVLIDEKTAEVMAFIELDSFP
jgi:hypothetical protein